MRASFKVAGRTLIVSPAGEIDHHSSTFLREKIDSETQRENAKNIIFDFSNVGFMDSSGIGLIIGRYKLTSAIGGICAICSMDDALRRIFDISGLKKIIETYKNVDEALAQLESQPGGDA